MYTIHVEPEIFPEGIWFNGFHQDTRIGTKLPVLEFLHGSMGMPADQALRELGYENAEALRELRKLEDAMYTNEELGWIFKGIPYGATSSLPEDKKQPVRKDKNQHIYPGRWDWSLGGFTHYGSNMTFKLTHMPLYEAYDLKEKLLPKHGNGDAYELKDRLSGVR